VDTFIYYVNSDIILELFFFFFQAEDGIRDRNVTGVQTCALPILDSKILSCSVKLSTKSCALISGNPATSYMCFSGYRAVNCPPRSEERRVGKECRSWWSRYY